MFQRLWVLLGSLSYTGMGALASFAFRGLGRDATYMQNQSHSPRRGSAGKTKRRRRFDHFSNCYVAIRQRRSFAECQRPSAFYFQKLCSFFILLT